MDMEIDWESQVRSDILAITEELGVQASRYGPVVDFRPVQERLGRLAVIWYDGVLRWDFRIEWPITMRPTAEYMRTLARVKIEQVLARIARGEY